MNGSSIFSIKIAGIHGEFLNKIKGENMAKERAGIFIGLFVLAIGFVSHASIVAYTSSFSTNNPTSTNGWKSVGTTPTVIAMTASVYDYDDGNPTAILSYAEGMTITGDGLLKDGGLWFDIQNTSNQDEAIGYDVGGTLGLNEKITFTASFFTSGSSVSQLYMQIWDLTGNVVLTNAAAFSVLGATTATNYAPVTVSLEYTPTALTAGHEIQIRVVENTLVASRDIRIDNVSVIPEPATLSLLVIGFASASILRHNLR